MTAHEFIAKWKRNTTNERAAAQSHFNDLCALIGHGTPADLDPKGEWFAFEYGVTKSGGSKSGAQGWADVWKKNHFGWEYKGKHKNLEAAYVQLTQYRGSLLNPPLLVVCDIERIIIHTQFNGYPLHKHTILLDELEAPANLALLRNVFHNPDALRPGETVEAITKKATARLARVAETMRKREVAPLDIARYLDRVVFCLFAEDIELLPRELFSSIVKNNRFDPARASKLIGDLFAAMAKGEDFGLDKIHHFNGNLFSGTPEIAITQVELDLVIEAASLDWKDVDASIFGTLFERVLDETKERASLGAHYTGRADIEALVDPVVFAPLRAQWDEVRGKSTVLCEAGNQTEAHEMLRAFAARLGAVRVFDPACGSGNFLYVSLQKMLDLELEVVAFAGDRELTLESAVRPEHFLGLEVNEYAFDLAQTTLWIGWLQWRHHKAHPIPEQPILRTSNHIQNRDAILVREEGQAPRETDWPEAEFIVGNPPFLGGSKIWHELGREYQEDLWRVWKDRVPGGADLCCYWFEKARAHIADGKTKRAGLIATQAIRGGANRGVLKRIKESGNIFFAESDRDWTLEGANVHVSMIGFDNGTQIDRTLDGKTVAAIHSNLSGETDVTQAKPLSENSGICFIGTKKAGDFDIPFSAARTFLAEPNPHGRPNSDVVFPWLNGSAIVQNPPEKWIISFGEMQQDAAALYDKPYAHVEKFVLPERKKNNEERARRLWWHHRRPATEMRDEIQPLKRYLATPRVSKFRIFAWFDSSILPDDGVYIFARDDDYFFGVLHSRAHEVWSLKLGTRLEDRPRYTPTSCFETFPFPRGSDAQNAAIAAAAQTLDKLRKNWLLPPEWTHEETLKFPASVDGPWARYVVEANAQGIGVARYPRIVPRDKIMAMNLVERTLTELYNEREATPKKPEKKRAAWLVNAHAALDRAVFQSYGWPEKLGDEEILARLLALNLERANT